MRHGNLDKRGYLVQFEARMSQTAAKADEWIPVVPGTEGLVAAALGKLVSEAKFGIASPAFADADVVKASELSGVSLKTFDRLAKMFTEAGHALAIPGGSASARPMAWRTAKPFSRSTHWPLTWAKHAA